MKNQSNKTLWASLCPILITLLFCLGNIEQCVGQVITLEFEYSDGRVEKLPVPRFSEAALLSSDFYDRYNVETEKLVGISTGQRRFVVLMEEKGKTPEVYEVLLGGSLSLQRYLGKREEYSLLFNETLQVELEVESPRQELNKRNFRKVLRLLDEACPKVNSELEEWTGDEKYWIEWSRRFNKRCGAIEFEREYAIQRSFEIGAQAYLGQLQNQFLPCSPTGKLLADGWSQFGVFGAIQLGRKWSSVSVGLGFSYRQHSFEESLAWEVPNSIFNNEQDVSFETSYLSTALQFRYDPFRNRWPVQPVLGIELGIDWNLDNQHYCRERTYSAVPSFEFDEEMIVESPDLARSSMAYGLVSFGLRYQIIEAGFFQSWMPYGFFQEQEFALSNLKSNGLYVKIFYTLKIREKSLINQ